MTGIVLPSLAISILGSRRVMVQRDMLLALRMRDLFEFIEWPITRVA